MPNNLNKLVIKYSYTNVHYHVKLIFSDNNLFIIIYYIIPLV